MELFETIKNDDGTFTQRYKEQKEALDGTLFDVLASEVTIDIAELQKKINLKNIEKQREIDLFDSEIAVWQKQLDEIAKQG